MDKNGNAPEFAIQDFITLSLQLGGLKIIRKYFGNKDWIRLENARRRNKFQNVQKGLNEKSKHAIYKIYLIQNYWQNFRSIGFLDLEKSEFMMI